MTVKHSLLALLADHPAHGYGLKSTFEASTAGAWPLNVGQVYTTLARLQRDGLVRPLAAGAGEPVDGDAARAGAAAGPESVRQSWCLTEAGRAALERWYAAPVAHDPPARDELAIKVLLAVAADAVDVDSILRCQRVATMERLQEYTLHKRKADPDAELPWVLLLDALILKAEAELAWLDLCAERLRHRASGGRA